MAVRSVAKIRRLFLLLVAVAAIVVLAFLLLAANQKSDQHNAGPTAAAYKWPHHPASIAQFGGLVKLSFGDPHANGGHPYQVEAATLGYFNDVQAVSGWTSPAPVPSLAPKGFHLVTARFMLANSSAVSFTGNVVANSYLIDAKGQHWPALAGIVTSRGPQFPSGAITLPGQTRRDGWLVFQVPHDSSIFTLVVAPAGDNSEQGAWNVWPFATPSANSS